MACESHLNFYRGRIESLGLEKALPGTNHWPMYPVHLGTTPSYARTMQTTWGGGGGLLGFGYPT